MRTPSRFTRSWLFLLFFSFLPLPLESSPLPVRRAPELDALFHADPQWFGGDAFYSVSLGKDRLLWLFGDSFWVRPHANSRSGIPFLNNTVAIQEGLSPPEAWMRFFPGGTREEPRAFFEPQGEEGYFWPLDGIRVGDRLYVFLRRIRHGAGEIGFEVVDTRLATISNPDQLPSQWEVDIRPFDLGQADENARLLFGSALYEHRGFLYVYGFRERYAPDQPGQVVLGRDLVLARVPRKVVADKKSWRFYQDGLWVPNPNQASPLLEKIASEFTVDDDPRGEGLILTTMSQGLGREGGAFQDVVLRFAPRPQGPFSPEHRVFSCPEVEWDPSYVCYAGKAHDALSSSNQWVVSYVANSLGTLNMWNDPRIYFPRLLRVTLPPR